MVDFYAVTKENIKEHNPNWQQIPDHPYEIIDDQRFWIWKKNSSFNPISHQPDIIKDPNC